MGRFCQFKYLVFLVLLGLLLIGCEDTKEDIPQQSEEVVDSSSTFGDSDKKFPLLIPEAQQQVENWSVFEDFLLELSRLNGSNINELKARTERLGMHTDSLSKRIPNDLYTNPVTSRLMVLRTRIKLLSQEVNRSFIDSVAVAVQIDELNHAATNLLLQINEKIQKDMIDLEQQEAEKRELEKQKRFLDSVYRAERRDNNWKEM